MQRREAAAGRFFGFGFCFPLCPRAAKAARYETLRVSSVSAHGSPKPDCKSRAAALDNPPGFFDRLSGKNGGQTGSMETQKTKREEEMKQKSKSFSIISCFFTNLT